MAASGWDPAIAALDNLGPDLAALIHESLPEEWGILREDTRALAKYVLDRKEYTRGTLKALQQRYKDR